jgi:hypothetical protein
MVRRTFVAVVFSLFYISMYPILIGGFVIYVYPYWSPRAAVVWVLGGILVQACFCLLSTPRGPRGGPVMTVSKSTPLPTQVGAGVLYAASILLLSGGCYQS